MNTIDSSRRIPLSAVVLTRNEAVGIESCIASLRDFDEVIVVDSRSEDDTRERARAAGARVVDYVWDGKYPKKKQWSLDNVETAHDWVLLLDADESPTTELVEELRQIFVSEGAPEGITVYEVTLDYVFNGTLLKHGHKVRKRALVQKQRVRFPEINDLPAKGIREVEGHYQPQSDGKVGQLKGRLLHQDRDPLHSWFARHNNYSDWEAYVRTTPGVRTQVAGSRSAQGRAFDAIPLKPLVFFLYGYVIRLGFLDGRGGLDYAIALTFYYWQISLKVKEARSARDADN